MLTWSLACTPRRRAGDHLVGVHVRRGARAGLEHVDRELRVVLARRDLGARPARSRRGAGLGEQAQLAVDGGGGALDAREPVHDRHAARSHPRSGSSRRPWRSRRPRAACPAYSDLLKSCGRAETLAAERDQLPGQANRVVIGHQKARARQHPQLRRRAAVSAPPRPGRAGAAGPGRPTAAAPACRRRGYSSSRSSRAPVGQRARAFRPRAGQGGVAGDVGERVPEQIARQPGRRARTAATRARG